ncbi:MAG: hypothetical protein IPK99_04820 [Flavobacteriales bacterium]|nr:hypothetical protein [Flavobacteriales bacterium]
MRAWVLTVQLVLGLGVQAQLLDSIGLFLAQKPRLNLVVDTRGSFISNRQVTVMGVRIGLEHGVRVRYGIGYNFLLTQVEKDRTVYELGAERSTATKLRLGYFAPYFSYSFYVRKRWEVCVPVQVGVGSGSLVYHDLDGDRQKLQRTTLWVYEPLMVVQYRFWKYGSFQVGWGFRIVARSKGLDEYLTAPIYVVGIRVFTRELWRDIHGGR